MGALHVQILCPESYLYCLSVPRSPSPLPESSMSASYLHITFLHQQLCNSLSVPSGVESLSFERPPGTYLKTFFIEWDALNKLHWFVVNWAVFCGPELNQWKGNSLEHTHDGFRRWSSLSFCYRCEPTYNFLDSNRCSFSKPAKMILGNLHSNFWGAYWTRALRKALSCAVLLNKLKVIMAHFLPCAIYKYWYRLSARFLLMRKPMSIYTDKTFFVIVGTWLVNGVYFGMR